MLNALVDGQIVSPTKKGRAACPLCSGMMIAKCGPQVTHHWAHEATTDCDPWSEPEGEWHRAWKSLVRPEQREVTMGPHRADIVSASGQVIELQHSSISAEDVAERCAFYRPMIWIFDVSKAYEADRLVVGWGESRYARTMMMMMEPEQRFSHGTPSYSYWTKCSIPKCTACMNTGTIASHGDCRECPGINVLLQGRRHGRNDLVDSIKKSFGCEKRTCAGFPISIPCPCIPCPCLGRGHSIDIIGNFCGLSWKLARLDWTYARHAGKRVLLDCGANGELVEVLSYSDRRREPNRNLNIFERRHLLAQVRVVHRASFVEWMTSGKSKSEMSDAELRGVKLFLNGKNIRRK